MADVKKKKNRHINSKKTQKTQKRRTDDKILVCPPAAARGGVSGNAWGYLCRAAVIFFAVLGVVYFVAEALRLPVQGVEISFWKYALISLIFTALFSVMRLSRLGALAGGVLLLGGAVGLHFYVGNIFSFALASVLSFKEAVLARLYNLGFYTVVKYTSEVHYTSRYGKEDCLLAAFGLLAALTAAVFVLCALRRVKVLIPVIYTCVLFVPVFVYNTVGSNLSVAIATAAFAALIVMARYDKQFDGESTARGGEVLFKSEESETVEKKKRWGSSAAAQGGFAALTACILLFAILLLPVASVKEYFSTIPIIDNTVKNYRKYITALLMGNDPILDELGYENNPENFEPRSTDAYPQVFTGAQLLSVQIPYKTNVYLRGRISVDYDDGAWYPASKTQLAAYRELFGLQEDGAERLLYDFYSAMLPSVTYISENDDYNSKTSYGTVLMPVGVSRGESGSSLCYLPSHYYVGGEFSELREKSYGVLELDGKKDTDITFVNYFDGIHTGRAFKEEMSYSTLAYVTVMDREGWYRNIAALIAEYNTGYSSAYSALERYHKRLGQGYNLNINEIVRAIFPEQDERVLLSVDRNDGTRNINVQFEKGIVAYVVDPKEGMVLSSDVIELTQLERVDPETNETVYYTVPFSAPDMPLSIRYREVMTDEQKRRLAQSYYDQFVYSEFVYDSYTKPSESEVISSALETIISESGLAFDKAIERSSTAAETYEQRHRLVMAIVDYLADNYTYTLTPTAAPNPELDGVENFLSVTREGYCVQYASAAALMLRAAGIPVRYVEGYVAADAVRNYSEEAVADYISIVRDYNSHAWIEVWFDGIGWVQYEATSAYYYDMYGGGPVTPSDTRPWIPVERELYEEIMLDELALAIEDAEYETESLRDDVKFMLWRGDVEQLLDELDSRLEDFKEYYRIHLEFYTANFELPTYDSDDFLAALESLAEDFDRDVTSALTARTRDVQRLKSQHRALYITLALAAFVVFGVWFCRRTARMAAEAEKQRIAYVESIAEGEQEKLRENAAKMSALLCRLLELCGSAPHVGEFRDEYAERLTLEYHDVLSPVAQAEDNGETAELFEAPDVGFVLDGIAAEEFGGQMSREQLREAARLYLLVRDVAEKRIGRRKYFVSHYILREI